nr:immunoglobulin light chain junction region [Macaca mulatta]
CMQGLEFPWTI